MPRIARLVVKGEKTVYHVMSRTALAGYVLEDVEKDFLLRHIRWLSKVYFTEILGFCIMENHFHILGRWCSLGYHAQTGNRDGFLSTDFGLREFAVKGVKERLAHYRRFTYEKGGLLQEPADLNQGLELSDVDRFRYRTRYFTDSGIIGTKEFVSRIYQDFKGFFDSKHEKRPKSIQGLDGIFSLKRLSENIG